MVKKKNKKPQKLQYAEDDNHPFHTNTFGNSEGVMVEKDESALKY